MSTSLSSRVQAPSVALIPADGPLTWRPATVDDLDAVLEAYRAVDAADHPHYLTNREELEEEFGHSWIDLERDSLLGIDEDGRVAAYGLVSMLPGAEAFVQVILGGGVRPEMRGRGIGTQLVEWSEARALQKLASSDATVPGWIRGWIDDGNEAALSLFTRRGFDVARYFLELRRDSSDEIPSLVLEGFQLVPFERSLSRAVQAAKNDAFRDHWGSSASTDERWDSFIGMDILRPDLSFVALAPGGEVAGFVLTEVDEESFEAAGYSSGYIALVGVPRAFRGNGIARVLLARTLEAIRDAGYEKAVLDVDSDSPTGALGLYESVGFREAHRSVNVLKIV